MSNNYWEDEDDDLDTDTDTQMDGSDLLKKLRKAKGVNAKAARLVLKDLDDVNEDTVNNWLEDNADLFGIKIDKEEPKVSETDRAALRQQDVLTQNAMTPDRAEDLNLRIDNADSMDALLDVLRSQQ